ncbi:MAG: metallophosphoesterase family protein [Alphaproteobacteria bacterium]|nr:metallophosphoesterase family protein [Alphaproteobacteria bacterium]
MPSERPEEVIYAIGDIHGCYHPLISLMKKVGKDLAERNLTERPRLIFLGDYVDRGPQSKNVIDFMLSDELAPYETHFLAGNHDRFFRTFLSHDFTSDVKLRNFANAWLGEGGWTTMRSYKVFPPPEYSNGDALADRKMMQAQVPEAHKAFLDNLEPCYDSGKYFFAHAGVRPGVPLARQVSKDMLWIRDAFLKSKEDFEGRIVVHGHTMTEEPEVCPNRIGIDTGAYLTGRLTCAVLGEKQPRFIFS